MLKEFNIAAAKLRTARSVLEIDTAVRDVLFAYHSNTNSITTKPDLTPKIKTRLIERAQETLFDLGMEVLYDTTAVPNHDAPGADARLTAAIALIEERLSLAPITTEQTKKLFHTRGLVSRHFRDLATNKWGQDDAKRADFTRIADTAKTFNTTPKK